MWKWYDAVVLSVEQLSPTTRQFRLRIDDNFIFKAGQFVTMDLPISDKRLKRWRSYSIANAPEVLPAGELEFCITRSDSGLGTQYLFEEVKVGTKIRLKAPDGNFILTEERIASKNLIFICTGTGIAPFRSMIQDIVHRKLPHRKLHLIFGTRQASGILYRSEFEQLKTQLNDFQYDIVLSRADTTWQGYQGYVHEVYKKAYPHPTLEEDFWICGWSRMIDQAVEHLLLGLKCDKSQIHYELYG